MRTGISLTDTNIKLVNIIGKKPQYAKIPLEKGLVEDGIVKDKEKFKLTLAKISRQYNLQKSEVIVSVPEKYLFSKTMEVSDHGSDLEEKITQEIESYVPSGAESYIDWQALEKTEDSEKIYIASIQKSLLDSYTEIFGGLSIPVIAVEPLSLALLRHVPRINAQQVQAKKTKEKTAQKAKEKESSAQAEKKDEAGPVGILVVCLEEDEIILVIANEREKIELTSVLSKETVGHESELLKEISDMRAFYDKKAQIKIGRVFITGEGASEALKKNIATQLGVPTEFLVLPQATVAPQDIIAFFPTFALSDFPFAFPKNNEHINLLSEEIITIRALEKEESYKRNVMKQIFGVFGILSLLYLGIFSFLLWTGFTLDKDLVKEKTALKSGKSSQLKVQASLLNKYIGIVKQLKETENDALPILSFMSEKTPGGIVILHYDIDFSKNTVTVSGQSVDRDTLLSFKQVLEKDGKFTNVKIPLSSLEKRGAANFSLSFEMKKE